MLTDVFIHPQALVESDTVGAGTRIWAFSHVMAGARLGPECKVGEGVFIEAGVELGARVTVKNGVQLWAGVRAEDCVFIGPNATFTNDLRPRVEFPKNPSDFEPTVLCRGASIGANATVVCGVRIGRYALVAAGSVVTRDVPDHALVRGVPARRVGWVCVCASAIQRGRCAACGRRYRVSARACAPLEPEK